MHNKPIQLHIPTPCHEDWQQMTPCEQGRFCGSCQKTVTDFSTWSDRALYEFFSKNTASVCGRFLNTQMDRTIHIPYQPKSRLYKIAIACGLTLMFGQTTDAYARVKAPTEILTNGHDNSTIQKSTPDSTGAIEGMVLNKNGKPMKNTKVMVTRDGVKVRYTFTDTDGYYLLENLKPGNYQLEVKYHLQKETQKYSIGIGAGILSQHNFMKNKNFEDKRIMGCPRF